MIRTRFFQRKVDMRSRKSMINFLTTHFRYNTMNSWNRSTSYAHCIKVHILGLPQKYMDKAYSLLDCSDTYDYLNWVISNFDKAHDYQYQITYNGRSAGYLVLIRGGWRLSQYKSHCTKCGQRNFQEAVKGNDRCGKCGSRRENFKETPKEIYTQPGKSIDGDLDFEDWSMDQLRERVNLVKEFDVAADTIRNEFFHLIRHTKIETRSVAHYETKKYFTL